MRGTHVIHRPPAPPKRPVEEVGRPTRDALTSLEDMFTGAARVAHDVLAIYDDDLERHDDRP